MLEYILVGLLGAFASVLANKGIAVFNDGLRPLIPEYLEKRMDRKALMATSFALSFGLVIGFGIPFSIGKSIVLVHSILLGTDIIGTTAPDNKVGLGLSAFFGALYGIGLVAGLEAVVNLFAKLPVNFLPSLAIMGKPIIVGFAVFPIIVIAYQFGIKKASISLVVVLMVRQFIELFGKFQIKDLKISLNADGMALLVAILIMLVLAITDKELEKTSSNQMLVGVFSERVSRIKKNVWLLAIMGGLVSATTSAGLLAGDPISLQLLSSAKYTDAGIVALARTIGFIPLVATTAISTGVYSPVGFTFVFAVGIFIRQPLIALVLGSLVILVEVLLLDKFALLLDKFPAVKACGDYIRTSITKVLEISLLVGSMMACNAMVGNNGLGFLFVIGFYTINRASKKPLVDMAVGPISTISFGIVINILYFLNLFLPAVK